MGQLVGRNHFGQGVQIRQVGFHGTSGKDQTVSRNPFPAAVLG
jgi:hypothetical protein